MIRWNDRPGGYSLSSYATSCTYNRLRNIGASSLFSTEVTNFDITQGQLADCFWISPTAENGAKASRIMNNIFLTQTYNNEGIFALNLYIRGRPMTITLDDYVPLYNGRLIFEDRSARNGNFWALMLEKAFAKITGNYE